MTQVRNSPTTVNNVVTYDCVIGVTNADYKLKPGMTANVSVIIAQREDVLTIPNSALRFHPMDASVAPTNAAAPMVAQATNSGNQAVEAAGQDITAAADMGAVSVRSCTRFMCFRATGENAKLQAGANQNRN